MANELDKKVEKIKAIYSKYIKDLSALKKKQNLVISEFIREIEKRKIEEIRKILS